MQGMQLAIHISLPAARRSGDQCLWHCFKGTAHAPSPQMQQQAHGTASVKMLLQQQG
jgi:hypothetical protein